MKKLSRRVSIFDSRDLPFESALLDVVDVLVLSTDRLASDPGGITIVRDWVLGGGRLWILLDEVQPDTVAALMGDAFATAVVDRVDVTHLEMSNARMDPGQQTTVTIDLEQSVDHVRVVPVGVTVTDTVNGWPAAFWQPMGAGRVFFTTLSTAAWMRSTTGAIRRPRRTRTNLLLPAGNVGGVRRGMHREAAGIRRVDQFAPAVPDAADRLSHRQSLHRGGSLGRFLRHFGGGRGVVLSRGRPERLLWITPLRSRWPVSCLSVSRRRPRNRCRPRWPRSPAWPSNRASAPAIRSDWRRCTTRRLAMIALGAERGGVFFPDMTAMSGQRRRIVWTDEGAWHWEDLELPAGVRTAPFQRPVPLNVTVDCRAQFGPTACRARWGPCRLRSCRTP